MLALCTIGTALLSLAPLQAKPNSHTWVTLDSDIPGVSPNHDANLTNPWGLALAADGASYWVADNGSGKITRYSLNGAPFKMAPATTAQVITVPAVSAGATGSPTALIIDHAAFATPTDTAEFPLTVGSASFPSQLLVATWDGQIGGYNPAADAAKVIVGFTGDSGSNYTGLALALVEITPGEALQHRLYTVNYGKGRIEVFENSFAPVALPAISGVAAFADPQAVTGFAPYNIQRYSVRIGKTIQRALAVTYVNQADPMGGGGYINVFDLQGKLITQFVKSADGNGLNAPWGMAIVRNSASVQDDTLLVGNFGDGTIRQFSLANLFTHPAPVADQGPLLRTDRAALSFDDLWSIQPGRQATALKAFVADDDELGAQDGTLFFSAGIPAGLDNQQHGLAGRISKK